MEIVCEITFGFVKDGSSTMSHDLSSNMSSSCLLRLQQPLPVSMDVMFAVMLISWLDVSVM